MANFGNIGEAFVDIRANFGKFQSDLGSATSKLGRNLGQIGRSAQQAGRSLTVGLTLPIVAAGVAVVKMGVDFEKEMTKIQTLVGIAGERVDEMGDEVLALSKDVAKGPQELARALFVVTSAGQRGAEAMKILEQAAKASAIGLGDTAEIARAVTSAVNAYGVENLNAERATEILVATVREGNLEAADLAGSLGRVIGIAANVGLTFDQVGAFIATFTRVGVGAEEAVTSLRGALAILVKPTKGVSDALATIGTTVEQLRADVVEKGIAETFGLLIKNLEGAGIAVAEVFPNIRALSGVLATAGSQGEEFVRISEAIANSQGIVREGFEETRKTAAFVFAQVFTELKSITAELGLELIPILKDSLLPLLRGMVKTIGLAADAFKKLPAPLQKMVLGFVALLAAAGPFLFLFGGISRGVGAVIRVVAFLAPSLASGTTGMLTFGSIASKIGLIFTGTLGPALQAVVAVLTGPVGWVVAIIAVIAIIVKWAASADKLTAAWEAVKNFFAVLGRFVIGVFGLIIDKIGRDIGKVVAAITPAIGALKRVLQPVVDFLLGVFTDALNAASGAILLVADAIGLDLTPSLDAAVPALGKTADEAANLEDAAGKLEQKLMDAAAAGDILVPGMERSAESMAEADAAAAKLAEDAEALAEAQQTAAQATLDALQPFSAIIAQWNLASAAGVTATQFTAAFKDQILAAGIEAGEAAALFEALGISVDELPKPLQEALAGLIATEKGLMDISGLAGELADLPLGGTIDDFKAALDSLQGPQSEAFKNAQRTSNAQKELNREFNLSQMEITALEQEIQAYSDANATAAQIQDKFGQRISAASKRAKLFGQELGKMTQGFDESSDAAKRNVAFAENFQKAWNTAIGNVVGNFLEGIQNMDFSFKGFFDNLVDTAKNLGRTLVSLFAGAIFKPILKIGQRFASNLADTIFSKLAGAKGPSGGLLGGLNIGGTFKSIGSTIGSAFGKLAPLLTNPITGAIAGIGIAIFAAFKLFTKTPLEAGVKEVTRDFGVDVSKQTLQGFTEGLGLTEEQFKPIRKDILASPLAFRDLLLPAAQASGQVDELVASFGNLTAFGKTFDLSGAAAKAAAGDFSELNQAFLDIFGEGGIQSVGGAEKFLVTDPEDAAADMEGPGVRTGELLGDIFVDRLDQLIIIMGEGFASLTEKLTEIVDRLTILLEGPGLIGADADAGALGGAATIEITINALDSASFREFMAGDGGDVFIEELMLRRQEQMVEVVDSAKKGVKE
jgi:TP901 family phage tail tape measure protein